MSRLATFARRLEVKQPEGSPPASFLNNHDLRPLHLKDRTWGRGVWLMFWLSSASNVANWQGVAAGVAMGLTAWETLLAIFGGRIVGEILIIANGRCGAVYHMPLPSLIRTSWGVYGAWWPVLNRIVMTIVFMGVTVAQGGFCVYVTLHAIFPSLAQLPQVIAASEGISTGQFIGIIIFWVLMMATNLVPVPKLKNVIYIKVVVFFASAFAMLGWCLHLGGGIGNVWTSNTSVNVSGSSRSWLIVRFFFLYISNQATFMMNAADWQRYSKKPNDAILPQMIGGPLAHLIINLVGGLVASAGIRMFGHAQWNPVLLLDQILTDNYSPGVRAGVFFLGAAFTFSTLISVVLQNGLPAGNDLAGLFPKYVDYRRGTTICGLLALVICPWRLLSSAQTFVAFLGNFGVFLSSFIGVMLVHYYLLNRGYIDVEALFSSSPDGAYYYWNGINLRALAAYIIGIGSCAYSFAGAVGLPVSQSTTRSFYFSLIIGIVASGTSYALFCWRWPVPFQIPYNTRSWLEPKDYFHPDDQDGFARESGGPLDGVEVIEAQQNCDKSSA